MKQMKLHIGIPCYKDVHPMFARSLINFTSMLAKQDINHLITWRCGDPYLSRARDSLANDFMNGDCTDFLQLDADLEFNASELLRMVLRPEPIVAGAYFYKTAKEEKLVMEVCDRGARKGDLIEVDRVGTGLLRVKREVFEDMADQGYAWEYAPREGESGTLHNFFPCGLIRDKADDMCRFVGEDVQFCWNAQKAGHNVWVDTTCIAQHWGEASFPIQKGETS